MRRIGRFFLYLFASIGGLFVLLVAAAAGFAIAFAEPEPALPDRIVLRLDLDKGLSDGRSDDPWRQLRGDETLYLHRVTAALAAAETDDRVVGLAIRLGGARVSLVHAQELRAAVAAFRKRGKFALAFSQTFGSLGNGSNEYYLAAATDEVWMQPSGLVALLGIGLETPFLKGALDKIGVKPEFEQRHEYKSAVELLTHDTMSDPSRESLTRIVESWMDQMVSGIARDRQVPAETLRSVIDRSPLLAAEARAAKLIDSLGFWEAFADAVKTRAEGAPLVDVGRYLTLQEAPEETAATVALIYGMGPIQAGESENSLFDSETFAANSVANAIEQAADSGSIEAIVLRVDSPGGSYIGSDTVRRAIVRAKDAGKPVIASMGRYAASGGYFVAMAADKIVALPGTMTGSIGVVGGKLATAEMWSKLGVNWARVGIGANAGMWSQIFPFSPSAAARHRAVIDFIYRDFTEKVVADRSLPDGRIDSLARGRIWSGGDALELGLVDSLGGLSVAMGHVREALKLDKDVPLDIVILPEPLSPIDRLRKAIADGVPLTQALASLVAEAQPDPVDAVLQRLEPIVGDASALRPPAGLLQMPPFRFAP